MALNKKAGPFIRLRLFFVLYYPKIICKKKPYILKGSPIIAISFFFMA